LSQVALPDRVEAALRAGRHAAAQLALERFEAQATEAHSAWQQARLACARAQLAEGEEATTRFD
jgi:hypothetical protein